jgi:predicted XRE-type DNA-binding protein
MEVPDEIVTNWIYDLKKKDITPHQRALLIKNYIIKHKLSQRAFSKEFGINKSTVEDWLLWLKIDDEKYEKLLKKGVSKTLMYRTLRDNKNKTEVEIEKEFENELDLNLWKCWYRLNPYIKYFKPKTEKTIKLINDVKEVINILENHYK